MRRMYHRVGNHFGHTWRNCQVTWVTWNLILVYLETVFASVPYRCMVWAEHTIGSEIGLDAADGTPR